MTLETGFGDAWPFEASIRRRIELYGDRVVDRLTVTAGEPMPVILGWHPWFRRRAVRLEDGDESAPVELSVGPVAESSSTRPGCPRAGWSRRDPTDGRRAARPRGDPVVEWPGGPRLEVHAPAAAAWVVYAAHPDGVCVEPVTGLPDGLNGGLLGDPPVAAPGAPIVAEMTIRWR